MRIQNVKEQIAVQNIRLFEESEKSHKALLFSISKRISELRKEMNLNLENFAYLCGLDRKTIYTLENMDFAVLYETFTIKLTTIVKIAVATQTGLETFLGSSLISPEIVACMEILESLTPSDKKKCINIMRKMAVDIATHVYIKCTNSLTRQYEKYIFGQGNPIESDPASEEERLANNAEIVVSEHKRCDENFAHGKIIEKYEDIVGILHVRYEDDTCWRYDVITHNKVEISMETIESSNYIKYQ